MTEGRLEFAGIVRGPINAEDLIHVPDTPWVITSGMVSATVPQGRLYLVHAINHSCQEIFPYNARFCRDTCHYGGDLPDLDPALFAPHGLDLRIGDAGRHTLYVVNHGGRESIEVFAIDFAAREPVVTWIGGIGMPAGTWPNAVAHLRDGGLLVTSTLDPDAGMDRGIADLVAGKETGRVVEWQPGAGWSTLPGSVMSGANGVVVDADGGVAYVGGWRTRSLVRLSRGSVQHDRRSIGTGVLTDNLRWDDNGYILATGHDTTPEALMACFSQNAICRFPSRVLRVDPITLDYEVIIAYNPDVYGIGTVAVQVDDEVWVGSARCSGIARFR